MTTTQRREEGQHLLNLAFRMQQAIDEMHDAGVQKSDRALLRLSAAIVYQIAQVVSNTLKHSQATPIFAAVTVEAMIESVAVAYHEITGQRF